MLLKSGFSLILLLLPLLIFAQDENPVFRVYEDGEEIHLPDSIHAKLEGDNNSVEQIMLKWLAADGFLNAEVETLTQSRADIIRGCAFQLDEIRVTYTGAMDSLLAKNSSEKYTQKVLEDKIKAIIDELAWQGYPFAISKIIRFEPEYKACSVLVELVVETGPKAETTRIYFSGTETNSQDYLRRISRFRSGEIITPDYLRFLKANLNSSELFNFVSEGQILLQEGKPVVVFEVQERSLNQFDGLLGYVPDATGNGQIVGDVELSLWNVLSQGNGVNLQYRRLSPETSELDLGISQDWIRDIPVGLSAGFQLYQNDTTYQSRNFDLDGYYLLNGGLKLMGGIGFEGTTSGNNLPMVIEPDGQKRTARLGFKYTNVDRYDVPTSGSSVRLMFGIANKDITDDSSAAFTQNVLELTARNYIPIFEKSVIATSLHGFLLEADKVTTNDLIRFGGANSFRGYAEQQFRAGTLLWGDVEYRFLLNRSSYLFGFGAAGVFERPKLLTETNNDFRIKKQHLFSTGFGLSYQTQIGRLKFTYAISPDESIGNGKVHFGLRTEV